MPGEDNPLLWQGNLGANLIKALATGKSWLADEVKLRRLRQLALGSNTQQEVDSMVAGWERKPWAVTYFRTGNQQYFRVLQYEMHSLKSFEEKLAQFAPGSIFTWASNGLPDSEDEKKMFKEISEFLTKHGIKFSGPVN